MNFRRGTTACITFVISTSFSITAQAQAIRECVHPQGAGGALTLGPDGNVWFIDGAAGCGTTPPGIGGASCVLSRVALDCNGYQHLPIPASDDLRCTAPMHMQE